MKIHEITKLLEKRNIFEDYSSFAGIFSREYKSRIAENSRQSSTTNIISQERKEGKNEINETNVQKGEDTRKNSSDLMLIADTGKTRWNIPGRKIPRFIFSLLLDNSRRSERFEKKAKRGGRTSRRKECEI